MTRPASDETLRLRVDPIACDGRGLCAELLPEWIDLDDWGYPIISDDPVAAINRDDARRAVAACPTMALHLDRSSPRPTEVRPRPHTARRS